MARERVETEPRKHLLAKQYGNIYTLWVANLPVVVLSGFHAVKEGLLNHLEELSDRPLTPFFRVVGRGKGVALSNGHTWKQHGLHSLRKLGLGKKSMESQIEAEAQQLVEIFAREKGQPFDPSMAITNSVSNVICAVTFGQRFSLEDENFKKLIEAIDLALIAIGSFSHALYEVMPWLMKNIPGLHRNAFYASKMMLSLAKTKIEKHKEDNSCHDPQDFIDFYLLQMERSKNDPDYTYDEENLAQDIHDLFITGTETTATALKWAILLLTNYPDIQDKVYKEIEDVLVSSSICYQDLKKLPYANAVFHEIQRSKYILLVGFPRQSTKDMNLRGFHILKGTVIIPNVRSVLLDPQQWETPEEFNPNHFLDKEGNFVAREEFLPFGAGARVCLGEQLARMEYFLFLTNLLRAFRFQLPEGVKKLNQSPIIGITTPPHPYKVSAVPRHSP